MRTYFKTPPLRGCSVLQSLGGSSRQKEKSQNMRKSKDKPEQIQQQEVKGAEELLLRCEGTWEEMKVSVDAEKAGQRWAKGRSRERQKKEITKGSYSRHQSLFVN